MTVFLEKARGKWRYDFQFRGKRYQGYCFDALGKPVTSRSAAKQAEGVEKRRVAMLPKMASTEAMTLAQVFANLAPEFDNIKDRDNKHRAMAEMLEFFGPARPIAEIDGARIRAYITFSLAQSVRVWTGGPRKSEATTRTNVRKTLARKRSVATANLYLHVLRQALKLASETRDPLTGEPVIPFVPKVPMLDLPKRKARPVPEEVLIELREILPDHLRDALNLTMYFGFRRGEAFGLKTTQIDRQARGVRLYAEDVKDREDAFLPASDAAMELLEGLAAQAAERGVSYLISYRGAGKDAEWGPIHSPKRAWKTAMKKIEEKFGARWRWHDLRAAYITYAALHSNPLVVQELARHSSFSTTKRYIEVANKEIREAAERAAERPALKAVK